MEYTRQSFSTEELVNTWKNSSLKINEEYQRGAEWTQAQMQGLIDSRLAVVELESAFALKLRTGAISVEQRRLATARFYMDLGSRLTVIAMTDVHFSLARLLILNFGASSGLRTLDALQLSVASELRRLELVDFFVSADAKLADVADTQGISVINPLTT